MIPPLLLLVAGCAEPAAGGKERPGAGTTQSSTTPSAFAPGVSPPVDQDGDHFSKPADGDDTDAAVNPGTPEVCNGIDDNCDGVTDTDATDARTWYTDADGDSYGVTETALVTCNQPNGTTLWSGDCDDADAAINPGAAERCDGIDQNCSGSEADAADATWWYGDTDGDGWGAAAMKECTEPEGYVGVAGDCDDTDASENPSAVELCDGDDDDCDGEADEPDAADASTWYADTDGDTYGDASVSTRSCDPGSGWALDATDCDDSDGSENPAAPEVCDGDDDDCDGEVDEPSAADAPTWYVDSDADSFGIGSDTRVQCDTPPGFAPREGDCDDTDPAVSPNALEECAATVDANCDGSVGSGDADGDGFSACEDCDDRDGSVGGASIWYADTDSDGFGDPDTYEESCFGDGYAVADATDCDDTNGEAYPGADEVWYSGADEACDGGSDWDADGDGHDNEEVGRDCDDSDPFVSPDVAEVCENGVDDDCSGDRSDCAWTGDMSLADADARYLGTEWRQGVGRSVGGGITLSTGVQGLLIGAEEDAEGGEEAGAVFLVDWSDQGDSKIDSHVAKWTGEAAYDHVGQVARIGDIDGDGVDEFVVGTYREGSVAYWAGAAYVLSATGTGSMSLSTATAKWTGESAEARAGVSVAGAGDTNGDGTPDWLVAANQDDGGAANGGAVYLITTPTTGTRSLWYADARINGEDESDLAGTTLDGPGDLDGDGFADVVAGSYQHNGTAGVAYVYNGPLWGTYDFAGADITVEGTEGEYMGWAAAGAGDTNGDGYQDLVVTALNAGILPEAAGRVLLFLGPLASRLGSGDAIAEVYGENYSGHFGDTLDAAGDVDGDGFGDVLATRKDGTSIGPGGAVLMYGPISGRYSLDGADLVLLNEENEDGAGQHAAGIGDVNEDGYADFMVGANTLSSSIHFGGAAYLFLGGGI